MDAQTIRDLAAHAAEIAASATVTSITMGEMADGSRRSYALVTTYDNECEREQEFRVTSPALWNSPVWASVHLDYRVDSWVTR